MAEASWHLCSAVCASVNLPITVGLFRLFYSWKDQKPKRAKVTEISWLPVLPAVVNRVSLSYLRFDNAPTSSVLPTGSGKPFLPLDHCSTLCLALLTIVPSRKLYEPGNQIVFLGRNGGGKGRDEFRVGWTLEILNGALILFFFFTKLVFILRQ